MSTKPNLTMKKKVKEILQVLALEKIELVKVALSTGDITAFNTIKARLLKL